MSWPYMEIWPGQANITESAYFTDLDCVYIVGMHAHTHAHVYISMPMYIMYKLGYN